MQSSTRPCPKHFSGVCFMLLVTVIALKASTSKGVRHCEGEEVASYAYVIAAPFMKYKT